MRNTGGEACAAWSARGGVVVGESILFASDGMVMALGFLEHVICGH